MEITPWTFEEADRYRETRDTELRRLLALRGYGLLPGIPKNLNVIFANNEVTVSISQLEGITPSGQLLQIAGDSVSLAHPRDKGRECYLVVYADGQIEQEINHVFFQSPRYTYDFCTIGEINDDCLPFAKLLNDGNKWKIQELYIPPCIALSSDPELLGLFETVKSSFRDIAQHLDNLISPSERLMLTFHEASFDDLQKTEAPLIFYKTVRRAVMYLSSLHLSHKNLPSLPTFEPFNNNDILKSFKPITQFLKEFVAAISAKEPVVKKPEEPVDYVVWDAEL